MRELVYLSTRKLRALDTERLRGRVAQLKATIKAPLGIGELAVESRRFQNGIPKLDSMLAELDRSGRDAVWFTEATRSGQWVHFEAPMGYSTVGKAVVFLDIDQPSDGYPSGGDARLVLHGSAEHLLEGSYPRTSVDELSAEASTRSSIDAEAFASVFNHFFSLIEYESRRDFNGVEPHRVMTFKNRIRAAGLDHVLPTLTNHLRLPYTAAWLAGRARVTAVAGPRSTVFATPLYVEHVSPPDPAL
jgi:hypothetical protein